jgi:CheY-like chemotaxis protein
MSDQALILLVEDDPNDALIIRRAFARARVMNPLQVLSSGEEAIDYLCGVGKYSNRAEYPLPALVLLDLVLRGMDGFEVLQWIRSQPEICTIRVVVLSGLERTSDVNRAYQLGANSFLVKPTDFDKFVEISQALNGYWVWLDKAPGLEQGAEEPCMESWRQIPGKGES